MTGIIDSVQIPSDWFLNAYSLQMSGTEYSVQNKSNRSSRMLWLNGQKCSMYVYSVMTICISCRNTQQWRHGNDIDIHNSFHNSQYLYCLQTYKLYEYTNNVLPTYSYILQWLAYIMGAKGAGNPIGFLGSLSDTFKPHLSQQGCRGCEGAVYDECT